MHTQSPPRFHVLPSILAVLVILVVHIVIGWQASLLISLAYSFVLPSKAYIEATLQVFSAWLILLVVSYTLAPQEVARMTETVINIIARNSAQGMGWILPIVSLLFAALLGFLTGVVGSNLRLLVAKAPYSESGAL